MPELDKWIENLSRTKPNENFRLWLSSAPHEKFPITILQNGIKMTTEPPRVSNKVEYYSVLILIIT